MSKSKGKKKKNNGDEIDNLINNILEFASNKGFDIFVDKKEDEDDYFIDFININLKDGKVYVGYMDVNTEDLLKK